MSFNIFYNLQYISYMCIF